MGNIGEIIAFERRKRKLTQRNLGLKTGISHTSIARAEKGTIKPGADTIQKLADFFNVSVDYLYGKEKHLTIQPNIPNVYIQSPLLDTKEFKNILELISTLNRDELIMLSGMILAIMNQKKQSEERVGYGNRQSS